MDPRTPNAARENPAAGRMAAIAFGLLLAAALHAPDADARGRGHGGHGGHGARIAGAVILGAVIAQPIYSYAARPVYYAPPVYYPPPAYYPPASSYYPPAPAVSYSNPPVYIEQQGQGVPPAASLSVEERLRRLQSLCGQGLLSAPECTAKRQELLRLM